MRELHEMIRRSIYDGLPGSQSISDGRYQLIGVERIEVFKGPSAFLNGLGGTTRPSAAR